MLEDRLERGEVIYFAACPFPLPQGHERELLLAQRLGGRHKSVSWDPVSGRTSGFPAAPAEAEALRRVLAGFGAATRAWLADVVPRYALGWRPDRVSFAPEEEATRRLRLNARNDLLHLDAFPNRPTNGWRILRLFVNLGPSDPRVVVTSETFPVLLERYGSAVGLPKVGEDSWGVQFGRRVFGLFRPGRRRSVYDRFMLRFHHFLKTSDEFQERCRKRLWLFAPGSAWLALTDTVSHAVLRGRFALDHSFFLCPASLVRPELSPPHLLQHASGVPVLRRAA
jgi:hypothetical protein